jgi:hypothetical protein
MRFYNQRHRFYCGVDLHARTLAVCILGGDGNAVLHDSIAARPAAFLVRRRAEALTRLVNTNSQYNRPPLAKKLAYAANRGELDLQARVAHDLRRVPGNRRRSVRSTCTTTPSCTMTVSTLYCNPRSASST